MPCLHGGTCEEYMEKVGAWGVPGVAKEAWDAEDDQRGQGPAGGRRTMLVPGTAAAPCRYREPGRRLAAESQPGPPGAGPLRRSPRLRCHGPGRGGLQPPDP